MLSFGGTKNGMLYGEAVVVLNPEASEGLIYLRKLNMQLASKMRFISAQLIALLDRRPVAALGVARERHGDAPAHGARGGDRRRRASQGVGFSQETQANAVFATLPAGVADRLREHFRFYDWDAARERGALDVLVRHDRGATSTRSSQRSSRNWALRWARNVADDVTRNWGTNRVLHLPHKGA